jgi:hypothetical protein
MRLLALNVATAPVLAFAFPQAPQVLAQTYEDGSMGRPLQLDGGPAAGSDNPGQTGSRSEGGEPSAGTKSKGKRSKSLRDMHNARPPFGGYVEHFGGQRRDDARMLFQRHSADALPLRWGPARAKPPDGRVGAFLKTNGATPRPPHECLSVERISGVGILDSYARSRCAKRCWRGPAPIHF